MASNNSNCSVYYDINSQSWVLELNGSEENGWSKEAYSHVYFVIYIFVHFDSIYASSMLYKKELTDSSLKYDVTPQFFFCFCSWPLWYRLVNWVCHMLLGNDVVGKYIKTDNSCCYRSHVCGWHWSRRRWLSQHCCVWLSIVRKTVWFFLVSNQYSVSA